MSMMNGKPLRMRPVEHGAFPSFSTDKFKAACNRWLAGRGLTTGEDFKGRTAAECAAARRRKSARRKKSAA